jgi:hypothetical protein
LQFSDDAQRPDKRASQTIRVLGAGVRRSYFRNHYTTLILASFASAAAGATLATAGGEATFKHNSAASVMLWDSSCMVVSQLPNLARSRAMPSKVYITADRGSAMTWNSYQLHRQKAKSVQHYSAKTQDATLGRASLSDQQI